MPRALQDRGICGLIAVQPALVVQHEWPEDETEFPVVRASLLNIFNGCRQLNVTCPLIYSPSALIYIWINSTPRLNEI